VPRTERCLSFMPCVQTCLVACYRLDRRGRDCNKILSKNPVQRPLLLVTDRCFFLKPWKDTEVAFYHHRSTDSARNGRNTSWTNSRSQTVLLFMAQSMVLMVSDAVCIRGLGKGQSLISWMRHVSLDEREIKCICGGFVAADAGRRPRRI